MDRGETLNIYRPLHFFHPVISSRGWWIPSRMNNAKGALTPRPDSLSHDRCHQLTTFCWFQNSILDVTISLINWSVEKKSCASIICGSLESMWRTVQSRRKVCGTLNRKHPFLTVHFSSLQILTTNISWWKLHLKYFCSIRCGPRTLFFDCTRRYSNH